MQAGRLATKLQTGEPALGFASYLSSEFALETFGWAGFDFVMIDLEHGTYDFSKVENLVRTAEASGMNALIRVWPHDATIVTKALDTGAMGIIVPFVESAEAAEEIVRRTRYPFAGGTRGSCPANRVARGGFLHGGYAGYIEEAKDPFVMTMIENDAGLEAVDEIAAVDGVDAVFFGPADYSMSIGADIADEMVLAARDTVRASARKAGKICMENVFTPEAAAESAAAGVQLTICATDSLALAYAAKTFRDNFDAAWKQVENS